VPDAHDLLLTEDIDRVRVLTLNRPDKANAFNERLYHAAASALRDAADDDAVSVVVVTGAGRVFSGGVDLGEMTAVIPDDGGPVGAPRGGRSEPSDMSRGFDAYVGAISTFPKPLVAAVNGHAIAGGCMIACAADRRLMARGNGRVGVPELLVGVGFPVVPLEVLRFAVSPEHFAEMVYSGATYPPEEALRRGLVDELVEPAELLPRAIAEAERMAAIPAAAFELTKVQMREPAVETMRRRRAQLDARVAEYWTNPATLDAIRGYVERTLKKK
jgi:enoyl-CoA hydratase